MFSELSPGSPFWQPAGAHVWNELTDLWRQRERAAAATREVRTPILYDVELWKQSGHWDKFRDNMYFTEVEERPMGLKPMNCPAHVQIFKRERRSYRDLPIRYAEQGLVHRHEPSGTLHGLLRVRHITQDDAPHLLHARSRCEEEVLRCLDFGYLHLRALRLRARAASCRPGRTTGVGSDDMWDRAEAALAGALDAKGLEYKVNEGDGAFYGPKIDLHMTDSIGRTWQLGTVQLDYSDARALRARLHRRRQRRASPGDDPPRAAGLASSASSAILIEHYAGEFPLWLAPVQAAMLPIADRHTDYARQVADRLAEAGLRVDLDARPESVGKKIREAEVRKVPVHARGRRPRGRVGRGGRAPPRRGRPRLGARGRLRRAAASPRSPSPPA